MRIVPLVMGEIPLVYVLFTVFFVFFVSCFFIILVIMFTVEARAGSFSFEYLICYFI